MSIATIPPEWGMFWPANPLTGQTVEDARRQYFTMNDRMEGGVLTLCCTRKTKIYDLAAAMPLVFWYCLGIRGLLPKIGAQSIQLLKTFDALAAIAIVSQVLTVGFMTVQIVLFIIRRIPQRRSQGFWPRAAAIVGSNFPFMFLVLPSASLTPVIQVLAGTLLTVGMASSIYVSCWLGRSFSILPEGRGLVTNGPYGIIRHPLYFTEQIAVLGVMLQFKQPWSLLLAVANMALQFRRMGYEEDILSETFPAYRDYMIVTPCLIPGFY